MLVVIARVNDETTVSDAKPRHRRRMQTACERGPRVLTGRGSGMKGTREGREN